MIVRQVIAPVVIGPVASEAGGRANIAAQAAENAADVPVATGQAENALVDTAVSAASTDRPRSISTS